MKFNNEDPDQELVLIYLAAIFFMTIALAIVLLMVLS